MSIVIIGKFNFKRLFSLIYSNKLFNSLEFILYLNNSFKLLDSLLSMYNFLNFLLLIVNIYSVNTIKLNASIEKKSNKVEKLII